MRIALHHRRTSSKNLTLLAVGCILSFGKIAKSLSLIAPRIAVFGLSKMPHSLNKPLHSLQPLMLATWSFSARGCRKAWPGLETGGGALDAVCTAARDAEADPLVDSVGFGGLPDATGRMSLDACVMMSPERCGSVCAVSRHLHVADLARLVMERTSHVMLVGDGADSFADALGMPRADLLSPDARLAWKRWRAGEAPTRPIDQGVDSGKLFLSPSSSAASPIGERHVPHDTIGVLAVDARGVMAGACSTSGLPFKLSGRVGDSPIPGHGIYVDPEGGGAVATGTGELVMGVSGSFLAVECMRRGATPLDAVREVLDRIDRRYKPMVHQQVGIIALSPDGSWSAGALFPGFAVTVVDAAGIRSVAPEWVLKSQIESDSAGNSAGNSAGKS